MRPSLLPALTGLIAGAAGAILVGKYWTHEPAPAPASVSIVPAPAPAMPILPPGWDPKYLARLTHVEAKLAEIEERAPKAVPAARPPSEHERERVAQYDREQEQQRTALADHDREQIDRAWSEGATLAVRKAIADAPSETPFQIHAVDCRSSTCVASVTFPSPGEALGQHRALMRVTPEGCRGMSSVLEPPTTDGPYETTLVYYCR